MKKLTTVILAALLLFSLTACGGEKLPETTAAVVQEETEQSFTGELLEKKDFMITVAGEDGTPYVFNLNGVVCAENPGQMITVTYRGDITDFDAQLTAIRVRKAQ